MPDNKFELMLEAERRGILPQDKLELLNEARKRGLIPDIQNDQSKIQLQPVQDPTGKWIYQKVIAPTIEGTGMIVGGLAGSAVSPIVGTVGGAALGYAGAKSLNRGIETALGYAPPETILEALKRSALTDIPTGIFNEMAGQSIGVAMPAITKGIGKVGKVIGRKIGESTGIIEKKIIPDITQIPTQKEAQRVLTEFNKQSEGTILTQSQINKNIDIAKELESKIPGLKFTQGQLTNDASAISLERTLARKGGQDLSQSQREFANTVLNNYYSSKVSGSGHVSDFIKPIENAKEQLMSASKEAQDAVDSEVMRLSKYAEPQTQGSNILNTLKTNEQTAKNKATELYNKIPNVKIQTDKLLQTINEINADFNPIVEDKSNIPSTLLTGLKKLITKDTEPSGLLDATGKPIQSVMDETTKPMNFSELRKLRSQIISEIRTVQGSSTPNDQYIRRLKMLQNGVEETIDGLSQRTDRAGELYREASSFYKDYATKFKQGTVADILAKGRRGENTRIALANIAEKFNTLDGIDAFKQAIGDNGVANSAMKDFYSMDLLNKAKDPLTGELNQKSIMKWLAQNGGKLKKLGIFNEFTNTAKLQGMADNAANNVDIFNKSIANRILNSDVDTMIGKAFSGSDNYGKTAQELMNMVKNNPSAKAGLQKAFGEHLMKNSETTGVNFFQQGGETISEIEFNKSIAKLTNQIKKYAPALREIYKNEPEKVAALHDVWNAYQILGRTAKSPIGGGSDTFELFGKSIDIIAGHTAPGYWYAYKTVRDMINKYGQERTNLFLTRAMFDPDYAMTLKSITYKSTAKDNQIGRLMSGLLAGLLATQQSKNIDAGGK